MSKLLIVIPAYNEEANIVKVVNGIVKNYPQYDYVVVNDGSRDKTAAICREHGFRLIDLPVNLGLAGAFQTGLRYAAENGYDCAMQLDADGQHRPEYIAAMLEELELAYCLSVHKSQGSEFPAVVLPVAQVPPRLCYRNLFYTGVTRARKLCIVAGRRDVVNRMMSNVRQNLRYSGLCELLKENLPPEQMAAD